MSIQLPYSMDIRWSDLDQVYIVHLAEFGEYAKTHGATYEEAARMGQEVLEGLVESYMARGDPLPLARKYADERAPAAADQPRRKSKKPKSLRNMKVKSNATA
jgi:predicted RNase H-like HicB family nuclease